MSKVRGPKAAVSLILGGSIAGQIVALGAMPLLSSLYTPQQFGEFAFVMSLSTVMATIATWRLELAIPLATSLPTARKVLNAAVTVSIITSITATIPLVFLLTNKSSSTPWLYCWIVMTSSSMALYSIYSQVALRSRNYTSIATRNATQPLGAALLQSVVGTTAPQVGLLAGGISSRIITAATLRWTNRKDPLFGQGMCKSPSISQSALREFWRFPVLLTPSALLNSFGTQLPILLTAAWFGSFATGVFAMGQRFTTGPSSLFTTALGQVINAELATKLRTGESGARRLYLKTSAALALLGVVAFFAILLGLPFLIETILPPTWSSLNEYRYSFALLVAFGVFASPLSVVFVTYQAGRTSLGLDVSRVLLVFTAGSWAHSCGWSSAQVLTAMSVGQSMNYIATWVAGYVVVDRYDSGRRQCEG